MGDLLVIMRSFTLKIKLGNDAMQTNEDIARSLKEVYNLIRNENRYGSIYDINGNKVGFFEVK